MRVFAAQLIELDRIGVGLGALGDHVHAEVVRQRDDRFQDDGARAAARGADERLIDLDGVEREALQIGQGRMSGAEIVERQAGAELANPLQHLRRVLRILHHQRFRQFQLQRAARDRRARQHGADVVDQVVPQQLPRRDVDAGEDRMLRAHGALPHGELARGLVHHEHPEIDDQAGLLGDGDEFVGRHPSEFGMVPARQGLEAGDRAILQPDDRLVEDGEFLALDGAPQLGLQGQAIGLARAHRWLVDVDAIAADALGVIHRELGVLDDLVRELRLRIAQCESDRGGQEDLAVVEGDRRTDGLADGFGEGRDPRRVLFRQQDEAELIAGEPRQRVLRFQDARQPPRQCQQD